jgi:hypothetical protein
LERHKEYTVDGDKVGVILDVVGHDRPYSCFLIPETEAQAGAGRGALGYGS